MIRKFGVSSENRNFLNGWSTARFPRKNLLRVAGS